MCRFRGGMKAAFLTKKATELGRHKQVRPMRSLKVLCVSIALMFAQETYCQGFLTTKDKKIVTPTGENVLLRGIGLGGWMLQEGYMLKVPKEGQQHVIKGRIQQLIGKEKTAHFYKAWLDNHTTKADIKALK